MALLTKKEITISRLELLSNLMASIFIKYIRNQHRIDHKAHIWTDSQITTSWITAARKPLEDQRFWRRDPFLRRDTEPG
jgi:hypothetical protein